MIFSKDELNKLWWAAENIQGAHYDSAYGGADKMPGLIKALSAFVWDMHEKALKINGISSFGTEVEIAE